MYPTAVPSKGINWLILDQDYQKGSQCRTPPSKAPMAFFYRVEDHGEPSFQQVHSRR